MLARGLYFLCCVCICEALEVGAGGKCKNAEICEEQSWSLIQNSRSIAKLSPPAARKATDLKADQRSCEAFARPLEEGHIPNPTPLLPATDFPAREPLNVAHIYYISEEHDDLEIPTALDHQELVEYKDNRAERQSSMENQLSQQNIPFSRFPAINRSSVLEYDLIKKELCPMKKEDQHLRLATYACAQSHLELYRKIAREDPNGTNAYLILEDDAALTPDWQERLAALLPLVPADAAALILGAEGLADCNDQVASEVYLATHPSYTIDDSGSGRNWYLGSQGTLVWPYTLPTLIHKIEQQNFACHSDVNLISAGAERSYAIFPPVIVNAGFSSTMNA